MNQPFLWRAPCQRVDHCFLVLKMSRAHDHYICRNELSPQQSGQPRHFREPVRHFRFDHQQVEVAVGIRITSRAWAEHYQPGASGYGVCQASKCVINQAQALPLSWSPQVRESIGVIIHFFEPSFGPFHLNGSLRAKTALALCLFARLSVLTAGVAAVVTAVNFKWAADLHAYGEAGILDERVCERLKKRQRALGLAGGPLPASRSGT